MEVTKAVEIFKITVSEAPQRVQVILGILYKILSGLSVHYVVVIGVSTDFRNQVIRRLIALVSRLVHNKQRGVAYGQRNGDDNRHYKVAVAEP